MEYPLEAQREYSWEAQNHGLSFVVFGFPWKIINFYAEGQREYPLGMLKGIRFGELC